MRTQADWQRVSRSLRGRRVALRLLLPLLLAACVPGRPPAPPALDVLSARYEASVEATAAVPVGWSAEPLKRSPKHTHQVWLSPSRRTGYGISRMTLPVPGWLVGHGILLERVVGQMRGTEGKAELVGSPVYDEALKATRFEVNGGQYHTRGLLFTDSKAKTAWVVYAATVAGAAEMPAELDLACLARERTTVGRPEGVAASTGGH